MGVGPVGFDVEQQALIWTMWRRGDAIREMERTLGETLPRIRRYLGWPQVSLRTLYRRVRLVAIWRRPKLTARGDPDHDHVVAQIVAR